MITVIARRTSRQRRLGGKDERAWDAGEVLAVRAFNIRSLGGAGQILLNKIRAQFHVKRAADREASGASMPIFPETHYR
jgi:hypothetical protein